MRITADTTILVRANVKATGPARELILKIRESGSCLVLSPFLLDEVQRVMKYPRIQAIYHLTDDDIAEHVTYLKSLADVVIPFEGPAVVLTDPNDDPVVYTALAGQADVICTLDRDFFEPNVLSFCSRHGIRLMDDVALLHELRRGEK